MDARRGEPGLPGSMRSTTARPLGGGPGSKRNLARSRITMTTAPAKRHRPENAVSPERLRFARNFRLKRREMGLSQQQIHARSGLALSLIAAVERGARNFTIDTASALAEAVETPLHELLR